jgi:hypothetical protein
VVADRPPASLRIRCRRRSTAMIASMATKGAGIEEHHVGPTDRKRSNYSFGSFWRRRARRSSVPPPTAAAAPTRARIHASELPRLIPQTPRTTQSVPPTMTARPRRGASSPRCRPATSRSRSVRRILPRSTARDRSRHPTTALYRGRSSHRRVMPQRHYRGAPTTAPPPPP